MFYVFLIFRTVKYIIIFDIFLYICAWKKIRSEKIKYFIFKYVIDFRFLLCKKYVLMNIFFNYFIYKLPSLSVLVFLISPLLRRLLNSVQSLNPQNFRLLLNPSSETQEREIFLKIQNGVSTIRWEHIPSYPADEQCHNHRREGP